MLTNESIKIDNDSFYKRMLPNNKENQTFILSAKTIQKYQKIISETPDQITDEILSQIQLHFTFSRFLFTNEEVLIYKSFISLLGNIENISDLEIHLFNCIFAIVKSASTNDIKFYKDLIEILKKKIITDNIPQLNIILTLLSLITSKSRKLAIFIYENFGYQVFYEYVIKFSNVFLRQSAYSVLDNIVYAIEYPDHDFVNCILDLSFSIFSNNIKSVTRDALKCVQYIASKSVKFHNLIIEKQLLPYLNQFLTNESVDIVQESLGVFEKLLCGNQIRDNIDMMTINLMLSQGDNVDMQIKSVKIISLYLLKYPSSAEVLCNLGNLIENIEFVLEKGFYESKLSCIFILKSLVDNCSIQQQLEIIQIIDFGNLAQIGLYSNSKCILIAQLFFTFYNSIVNAGDFNLLKQKFNNEYIQTFIEEMINSSNEQISAIGLEFLELLS